MFALLRVPAPLLTAATVSGTLDAVILADGQVIEPDKGGLVKDLQGRAEAPAKLKRYF